VHIRPARPDEVDAVGTLTLAAYVADGLTTPTDPYAEDLLAAGERAAEAELMVAEVDGAVVGTVTYVGAGTPWAEVSEEGESELRMLAVAPAGRGHGIGRALTQWCIDRATADACTALVLSSRVEMHAAHRLYERLGFVRTPERDWWPTPTIPLVAYRLPLPVRSRAG
jgi:ribosomal protein S18 acetylase RimI-like enzyme